VEKNSTGWLNILHHSETGLSTPKKMAAPFGAAIYYE